MKKIFIGISAVFALLLSLTGCESDYTTYSGRNYIMFSDTLTVLPVLDSKEYFDIPVAATQTCSYDRTLGVEIIDKKSNAIEGYQYTLESTTVTIKAGERLANVRVRGIHDHIAVGDSIGFVMQLVSEKDSQWGLYGTQTKIMLQKVCAFDLNRFTGYALITASTYLNDYTNTTQRLIQTEIDPKEENTIIMKSYFYDGYDMKIKFSTKELLEPLISMEDQKFASTADAFGTVYGKGMIYAYQPTYYVSYYSSCEKFIYQYMTLHVPGMATGTDVVGTYINVVQWISDEQAEKLKREGL